MERIFSVNLAGKVKNYSLSKRKALMPLFEAIINSINAIDERRMPVSYTHLTLPTTSRV